jgi:RNA polymerase sigma-70 factor (ECF subfamily)
MKGNANSMVLAAGKIIQLRQRTNKPESPYCTHDRDTFLAYLLPIKKNLYNFIQKTSNFSPDTDDLFQDTLLKAFRYFYSFNRQRNFKTWIFSIAHNLMKDAFQKRQLRQWQLPLEDTEEISVAGDKIKKTNTIDVQEVYAVASSLKPRHREVFFLYYYNEFTISEINRITGLSRPNIKFMLHQARKAIKKALEVQV